ncbi:MAG: phosphoribosylglycinamide formyltransferase [Methylacidiphilales bacterium]|nr:phosphoribosylglycinamide formyltransferase [Candidatus Methylacidiphilales bacterium]
MMRIAVLISGNGSNLAAIHHAILHKQLQASIEVVLSSNESARGLQYATSVGLRTITLPYTSTTCRKEYSKKLRDLLKPFSLDWVVLAGFMRIITEPLLSEFKDTIINMHPSLLPLYPGLHTHEKALAARDKIHGSTIHLVNAKLDDGPIIAQAIVPVEPEDNPERLALRVKKSEWQLYPRVLELIATKKIKVEAGIIKNIYDCSETISTFTFPHWNNLHDFDATVLQSVGCSSS